MEIEIRAKIKNIKNIERCIIGLGAKLVKQKRQIDKYFGEINLFKKLGYSFLMRVRNEGDKKFLTYKGAESKKDGVWEEYEFNIDNEIMAEAMLKAMGLEKIIEVNKNRIEYKIDNLTICLDTIENLGCFVEIESQDDNDIDKDKLKKFMDKLNIKENQIMHKGYVTMLLIKNDSPYSKYIVN
ncbi:MAG: class IV adenylate cyclase [bacterium]|nr:class IV adenylate cyclase [bacterium]